MILSWHVGAMLLQLQRNVLQTGVQWCVYATVVRMPHMHAPVPNCTAMCLYLLWPDPIRSDQITHLLQLPHHQLRQVVHHHAGRGIKLAGFHISEAQCAARVCSVNMCVTSYVCVCVRERGIVCHA